MVVTSEELVPCTTFISKCYHYFYRQDAAKRQTICINFTRMPPKKISIFDTQGRLVAPIHVKFGMANRHAGSLGHANFQLNRCTLVSTPKIRKFPHFGKDSPLGGIPLDRFVQILEVLCVHLYCISVLTLTWFLHRLRSYCRITAPRSFTPIIFRYTL